MNQLLISYSIVEIFATYTTYRFMKIFFEGKEKNKTIEKLSYVVFYIMIIVLYLIVKIPIINLFASLAMLFSITFNYKAILRKKILSVLIIYVMALCVETIVLLSTNYIYSSVFGESTRVSTGALICSKIMIYMVMILLSKSKGIRNGEIMPTLYWLLIILVPTFTIYVVYILSMGSLDELKLIAIMVIVFVINYAVFYLYDALAIQAEEKAQAQLLAQMNESYLKQFDLMKENSEVVHQAKHDLKNYMMAIEYMAGDDKPELVKYVREIMDSIQQEDEYLDSRNPIIDSILNVKIREAKESGIEVKIKSIIPMEMPLMANDMTFILTEVMNYAIRECKELSAEKSIRIILWYHCERLYIRIIHKLVTEKGLGDYQYDDVLLEKIESIVEKEPYIGGVLLEATDDEVEVCVSMRIQRGQKYD